MASVVLRRFTRHPKRRCPQCRRPIKRGAVQCRFCGYDYVARPVPADLRPEARWRGLNRENR